MNTYELAALLRGAHEVRELFDNGSRWKVCATCGAQWPCPTARAADVLEAQQKRIEALERVAYEARLWVDEADCIPTAVEDALDSLS